MEQESESNILIYQAEDGSAMLDVHLRGETVWLSQDQMATLFAVQKAAISKHLRNIYASGELERLATVSKMETVAIDEAPDDASRHQSADRSRAAPAGRQGRSHRHAAGS